MKHIHNFTLYAILCFLSVSLLAQKGYDITLEFKGVTDSTGYLGYHYGEKRFVTDTASISGDGLYRFKGNDDLKSGVYFLYTKGFYFEFVMHQENNFSISSSREAMYKGAKIKNSPENEVFFNFQLLMSEQGEKQKEIQGKLAQASSKEDSTLVMDELKGLDDVVLELRRNYQREHKGTYISKMLALMNTPVPPSEYDDIEDPKERYRKRFFYIHDHFFDDFSPGDSTLIRTPNLYKKKIFDYVDNRTVQHPDSLIEVVDFILSECVASEEAYKMWLNELTDKFQKHKIMGMDKVFIHIAKNYYVNPKPGYLKPDWLSEETMKKLKEEIEFVEPNLIGNIGKEIIAQDSLGNNLSTHQSFGNEYLVLFLYDPGCSHCKKKAPVMHEAYKSLKKDKLDVEFVAISTVQDEEKWKKYINEKQYQWKNLADLKLRSNFRRDYNVRTVPQIYVLDKDRRIIAKKIDAEQIESFVRDQFELKSIVKE